MLSRKIAAGCNSKSVTILSTRVCSSKFVVTNSFPYLRKFLCWEMLACAEAARTEEVRDLENAAGCFPKHAKKLSGLA